MNLFADKLLKDSGENMKYNEIKEGVGQGSEYIEAIREEAVHTFEEQQSINIDEIAQKLKAIETAIKAKTT